MLWQQGFKTAPVQTHLEVEGRPGEDRLWPCTEGVDRPVSPPGLRVLMGPVGQHRAGRLRACLLSLSTGGVEVGGDPLGAQPAGRPCPSAVEPGDLGAQGPGWLAGDSAARLACMGFKSDGLPVCSCRRRTPGEARPFKGGLVQKNLAHGLSDGRLDYTPEGIPGSPAF